MDFDLSPRSARDQGRRARAAHRALAVRQGTRGGRGRRSTTPRCGASWSSSAGRGSPSPRSTAGRASARSSWPSCARSSGTRARPRPFLSTATAAAVIQATGTDEQRARWLPGLASGELTAGIGTRELAADAAGAAVVVVLDGDEAQWLIELARDRGRSSRSIPPGGSRPSSAARERPSARAPPTVSARPMAAEVVGVCQRALDMTLAYVKERKQFGVPVGSFQAVAHRCAEMLLQTESARSHRLLRGLGRRRRPAAARRGGGASWAPRRPKAGRRSPPARSRCTAASASPGRLTCTGCTSARSSTRRCWAGPSAIARHSPDWPPRVFARGLPVSQSAGAGQVSKKQMPSQRAWQGSSRLPRQSAWARKTFSK